MSYNMSIVKPVCHLFRRAQHTEDHVQLALSLGVEALILLSALWASTELATATGEERGLEEGWSGCEEGERRDGEGERRDEEDDEKSKEGRRGIKRVTRG